jgi:fengycin family lipopeptide synthetase D
MINRSDIKDMYFLSPLQEGMLFHYLEDKNSRVYFEQLSYWLKGELDYQLFEQTFIQLVDRYDVLRTIFVYEKLKKPLQVVLKKRKAGIFYKDISLLNEQERINFIEDFKIKDLERGFELSRDIPMRISIIKTSPDRYFMTVSFHHIILDGWSVDIINLVLVQIYKGLKVKTPAQLEPAVQYKDYIKWLEKKSINEGLEYWQKYLEGYERPAVLPKSFTKAPGSEYKWEKYRFSIDQKREEDLIDLSRKNHVTQSTICQAIWGILLSKYNNANDVVFGVIVSGRSSQLENVEKIVGLLLNNVPVRIILEKGQTFVQLVREMQEKDVLSQSYHYLPLAYIQSNSLLKEKLIDHIMVFENYPFPQELRNFEGDQDLGFGIEEMDDHAQTNYDLNIDIFPENSLTFEFRYNSLVYDSQTIEHIARDFEDLITCILENPQVEVGQVGKISSKRETRFLHHFNQDLHKETESILKGDETVQHKLDESFHRYKNNIAVQYDSRKMTYNQLDKRSKAVAQWIINKGIKKETFIGILVDDRMELITLALGILQARCVMVPLYSSYPKERIKNMIYASDMKCIFVDEMNFSRFESSDLFENKDVILPKDLNISNHATAANTWKEPAFSPDDKVYLFFTSGTTGIPKAIVGKNKSLLHFIKWEVQTFNINHTSRISQFTIPGFDPFLRDVFVPLLSGGVICIPGCKDIIVDSLRLIQWVNQNQVTLIHCVSSLFRQLCSDTLTADDFKALQAIMLAGEKITPSDLVNWYEIFGERIQLVNCYGPTETTLFKVCYFTRADDINKERIPIGKPIAGSRVIILNEKMNICDILEAGEICIRTPYRSFGYYNDDRLNKQKFIVNPFNSDPDDLIYRSGDMGRFLPDGNIDILGRIDRQVKIRGHRIELEEIESLLCGHPSIKEAVVLKKETSPANEFLCAFITGAANKPVDMECSGKQVKEFLGEKLPDYMVPTQVIQLESIPRKVTGKVDHMKLDELLQEKLADTTDPRNIIEKKLSQLWSEILGIKKTGVLTNFFDLGGNSLNMMTLISLIHKEFNIKISPRELFDNPTIEKQAAIVEKSLAEAPGTHAAGRGAAEKYTFLKAAEKKECYPSSLTQKRFFIVQQLNPGNTSYNVPSIINLQGHLENERLEEIFNQLIKRHECLRISFELIDGELIQKVHDEALITSEFYQVPEEEAEMMVYGFIKPFNLANAPLMRVGLIKTAEANHILMIDMHHIITDGLSIVILSKEFLTLYEDKELPPLRIQYTDFSEWQNGEKEKERIEKQGDFWLKQFQDQLPVLKLRTDHSRPPMKKFEGTRLQFDIAAEETQAVTNLALRETTSIFMVLFAVYNILLEKLTGQADIIIGTGVIGRSHADLMNVIGLFFNTIPLRNPIDREKSFCEFLKIVKENTLEAFENQDYPMDMLIENLLNRGILTRDPSRNPLFDTMFAMQNFWERTEFIDEMGLSELKAQPYGFKKRASRFDLFLVGTEIQDIISMQLEYSTVLFEHSTAQKIADYYLEILKQVLADGDIKIKDISISSNILEVKSSASQKEYMNFGF